jgi:RimJ/RimL family protein N-acetyltransferase
VSQLGSILPIDCGGSQRFDLAPLRQEILPQGVTLVPVTLESSRVRLEPLEAAHAAALLAAAADGQLWELKVTVVPSRETWPRYLEEAQAAAAAGRELPFVIRDRLSGRIVGTTRYRNIDLAHRRVEIGSTWLALSAQRTPVNTHAKLLLLTQAFESLGCQRVELVTDALNTRSGAAILRLGAVQEGIYRRHLVMPDGRQRDSVMFSILAAEWPRVKAGLVAKAARAP